MRYSRLLLLCGALSGGPNLVHLPPVAGPSRPASYHGFYADKADRRRHKRRQGRKGRR